jgi:polyhydroxyalkanoate synthesis regulator phasin
MNLWLQSQKHRRTVRNIHNDAVRNLMRYTLGTAAKATGKAKSTILRAIKSGTISANKAYDGSYEIEPAELHRVFEPNGSQQATSNDTQPPEEQSATLRLRLEILETERQRERDQMQATIDDLRARLDRSEDRISALLAAPPAPKRWWIWR